MPTIPLPHSNDGHDLNELYTRLMSRPLGGLDVINDTVAGLIRRLAAAEADRDLLLAALKEVRDNVRDDSPDMWRRVEEALADR